MSKWLNKINNVGDSTISLLIQDNLIELFDWGLIDAGGFTNISVPTEGQFGGDKHQLRLVDDPRYTSGQVWESFRSNWIWQSGLACTDQPKTLLVLKPDVDDYPNQSHSPGVSGVFVDGAFQPTSGVGPYKHHIDYPNGRVVFDSAVSTTSAVTAEFSHKWANVTKANADFFREIHYRSERADDFASFTAVGSGDWSQLADTRLQLPVVAIEVVKSRKLTPYALGGLNHFVNTDVLFHVLAEDDHERDKLLDIVSLQDGMVYDLFDSDMIGRNNAFPLDYRGMVNGTPKMYPTLVAASGAGTAEEPVLEKDRGYPYGNNMQLQNPRVQVSDAISPNLYHGVVRMNTEVIM
tara:strand:+ start:1422 stop:2471 length:1050 start_codon:yes stop_codon:yes gene_type:complete